MPWTAARVRRFTADSHMTQTEDVCDGGGHGTQRSTDPKLGKQRCFE